MGFRGRLTAQEVEVDLDISFRRIRFAQESTESNSRNGVPSYGRIIYPVQFGLTYTTKKWHLSASGYYNYQNEFDYFAAPTEKVGVQLNPVSFNLSLLRYVDSDRSMRTKSAVRQVNEDYATLKDQNLLSAWFAGIGQVSL